MQRISVLARASMLRARRIPNPYNHVRKVDAVYGKYAKYFDEPEDALKRYDDKWDKHVQRVDLESGFYAKRRPRVSIDSFIAPNATVAGDVEVWDRASIWYGVVIRGDMNMVRIGHCANVQDNTVIEEATEPVHADHDGSTVIGHFTTIGHGCLLRAATVENHCLIGMGSKLMEGSYMEAHSQLGAYSVLEKGQRVLSGQLWAGNPARYVRDLTGEEIAAIEESAENYYRLSGVYKERYYLAGTQYIDMEKKGIDGFAAKFNTW